ncbi:NAD(P)H-hydrate dehydratase [Microbacterium barkeri]|uniref:ADP-dependent NAD(P)H-hydrate dehydratase n=1 Tax=Microbacterium barkeri TaxID=33917 RepID=UPI0024AFBF42|nr:ADP/ATP-dependent (S)-NAD(P)H-hydrate dehydratase [Microbacterium barkeri]MDI6943641.1 NAD(P)H-hydrate dehydratase [Microbacterium barkeri]
MSLRSERVTPRLLRGWGLPDPGDSKYSRGTVLVVGGALRSPGAAILAGTAALRVGAGRITLAVARSVAPSVGAAVPESGIVALPETDRGSVRAEASAVLVPELDRVQAVLVGSGLDDIEVAGRLLASLAAEAPESVVFVVDAFALGALAADPDLASAVRGRLILTPSPTELGVLLDEDEVDASDAREIRRAARETARRYGAAVATQSLVADADGSAWAIRAGGAGLGTSGSGDVLAGAVAGFAARGVSPARAAVWATYVHATAGDELARGTDGVGFLAGELAPRFPGVIADVR